MNSLMSMLMKLNPNAFNEAQRLVNSNGGVVDKALISKALNGNKLDDKQVENIKVLCKQLNIPVGNIDSVLYMLK